ncbi:peptidase [Bacterioplanes sanyensis]|uniref:imelysin family protein n=1 Tax=Bacterioplanes sanyensis TaxID=1249553 RepID=UPI00167B81C3|nr:imelysin family protein [Bacterioplanes sanyensis]GGY38893.1 peptidase [Bacterioplanes sanyensis]
MNKLKLAAALSAALMVTACGSDDNDSNDKQDGLNLGNVEKVLNTNADIAYAAYSDAVTTAEALKTAIAAFKADPTQANLDAAKQAWLVAREPYGQTEVYRFRMSPIDSSDYSTEDGPEGDINAWPLGEALIDYVKTNDSDFDTDQVGVTEHQTGVNGGAAIDADVASNSPAENIIGNRDIEINADLLANTATAEDERDVISGYHAIEFLLWGQDLNNNAEPTIGSDRGDAVKTWAAQNLAFGGQRPLTDFTTDANADRRFQFLEVAVDKLIADLKQVRDGWAEGASYRTAFVQADSQEQAKQKLAEIMTGMGTLSEGELAGERMQIAFSANSQEDEHSCFSDNTHRDIWLNAEGVANSFYGDYAGYDSDLDGTDDVTSNAINGYGLDDLLKDAGHNDLVAKMTAALAKTETGYTTIDNQARAGTPFDVLIQSTDTSSVADTIIALNEQSAVIAEIATQLELGSVVVDPEASACDTQNPTTTCEE